MKYLDKKINEFYRNLDRKYFLDFGEEYATLDLPLSIGYGQTISQPSLVLEMTLKLDLTKDLKVLEIGTGSGYQTAFLAQFSKWVYTIERIEPLYINAKNRLSKYGFKNISYLLGDGSYGWKESAPYDRIIVTASSIDVPEELLEQLDFGGKMIIPVGPETVQELMLVTKSMDGKIEKESIEYVKFVRLIGKYE